MKKLIFASHFIILLLISSYSVAHAQMMRGDSIEQDDHTAREEAEGKEVWKKLQSKTVACQNLSDEDFEHLGEYFMGQMMGVSHSAMNEMITRMHSEEGENQIHIAMGKRLSGCDPDVVMPIEGQGWMPMMQMMWGGWLSPFNNNQFNNHMMYGFNNTIGGGLSIFGGIFMILWWVLIIAAVVSLIKWILRQGGVSGSTHGKSAIDVVKERYAKGEIDKKEFEEKKNDLM